jgi:hypothetical protein
MIYYIVGSLLIIISVNEVSDINNLDRFTKWGPLVSRIGHFVFFLLFYSNSKIDSWN